MQILLNNEPYQLQEYEFNYEDLKAQLIQYAEKYRNLVVSEDAIKEAKGTRAELNKAKKAIADTVLEIKRTHLAPFDAFKIKTDELIRLIDEPAKAIDEQVKAFEQLQKDEKLKEIILLWEKEKPSSVQIPFEQVFKEQWLNATVSTKKIREEIAALSTKIVSDLQVIESFNSPDEFAIKETYLKRFDMSEAMREKARIEQRRTDEAEREQRLKAEIERKEAIKRQQEAAAIDITSPVIEENAVDITKPALFEVEKAQKEELIKALLIQIDQWNEDISILQAKINANNKRIKELEDELKDDLVGEIEVPF